MTYTWAAGAGAGVGGDRMIEPVVTSIGEDAMQDPVKGYIPAIKVMFLVGDYGPFTLRFPKDEFTAEKAQQAMRKFATEVGLLPRK